ncbi:IclR family transcriptional regulator domain-containing protein [Chthonobacter albigriseus]|uniref:IclR family transcriptional regulator domain-containing protein n=1 Tax=Chthonobacter albigriseus TaxID=1683161 RepID=UPI0019D5D3A5
MSLSEDLKSEENESSSELDLTSPISRAFHVLDVVAGFGGPARFADVQKASPLPKATLSRMLRQLEGEGMLIFDEGSQRYRLGLRLIRLAHAAWESASLVEVARPVIDALAERFGMTVHLACLDAFQVLYLDKRVPRPIIRMFSSPGRIGPAYCTGVGKAMLAFLPDRDREEAIARQSFTRHTPHTLTTPEALRAVLATIRERGFAFDDEEHENTIICVAVPILAPGGAVLGALSVTTTTHVSSLDALAAMAPVLKGAAADIATAARMQMLG